MSSQPRRQLLVETAFRLFNEHGYHATGIDWILAEAGVSKATLYKHFPSKEALILEVLIQRHQELDTLMRSTIADAKSEEFPVLAIFDALHVWFQSGNFYGCNFIKASGEYAQKGNEIHEYAAWHKETLKGLIIQELAGFKSAHKKKIAEALLLLVDGAIVEAHMRGDKNAAKRAKEIARLMVGE